MGVAGTNVLVDWSASLMNAYYTVVAIPTNAPTDLDGDGVNDVVEMRSGTDPLIAPSVVINEIDYDQVGSDTAEFVELYNPTATNVSLTNIVLVLIDGSSTSEYMRVSFTNVLGAGQYLVVGLESVVTQLPANVPGVTISGPFPPLQNGGPDGVLLLMINGPRIGVVDALSYEGELSACQVNGILSSFNLVEGQATSAADSNTTPGSLARIPNGYDSNNASVDWAMASTPTPGTSNIP